LENYNANTGGKKSFDFKYFGIGLIFFMDFNINTIDFLPDLIGLFFISAAIGNSFCINENLAKAKKYINVCYFVSIAKFIWNIIYFLLGIKKIDSSDLLLFTVLLSSFEVVLGILIFSNIFKALDSFFQLGNKLAYLKNSDFAIKSIKFFMVLKFALSLVPLLPILLTESAWDGLSLFFDAYLDADFAKNLLLPPCFIIQTLIALFLLSLILPFFFAISKDDELHGYVKAKINHKLLNNHFFVVKQNLHSAFLLFILGCVFFADLFVDNINFLPDFAMCVLFVPGIFMILRKNPELKSKKLFLLLLANSFVSVFAYITGIACRLSDESAFSGENAIYVQVMKYLSVVSFLVSVIIFFFIFIEFLSFVLELRRCHLEFSERYLDKYLTSSEKNYGKHKNRILRIAAAAFCVKAVFPILPQSGIFIFAYFAILSAFAFFAAKGLYSTKEAIYSCYSQNFADEKKT